MSIKTVKQAIREATTNDEPGPDTATRIDDAEAKKIVDAAEKTASGKSSRATKGELRLVKDLFDRRLEPLRPDEMRTMMLPEFPGKVAMTQGAVDTFKAFMIRNALVGTTSIAKYQGTWKVQGDDDFTLTISRDGTWKMAETGSEGGGLALAGQKSVVGKIGSISPEAPSGLANVQAIVLFTDREGKMPIVALPIADDGSFFMPGPDDAGGKFVRVAS